MPTFTYKAIGADGAAAKSQIDAANWPEAFKQAETSPLQPVGLVDRHLLDAWCVSGTNRPEGI
jgi:type II secretory pathway component PulF